MIGGGDFAPDRIVPDCVRAVAKGKKIAVRNPHSTRPYQHVLEPLGAYLMIAQAQYENPACAGSYNVGPGDDDCITTGQLADLFCDSWGGDAAWENLYQGGPHEANFLKLDCSKIRTAFGWKPHWQVKEAIAHTVEWYQAWLDGENMAEYNVKSLKAEEFINDGEILDTLDYAEKNKDNLELIDKILEKAKERKGLNHREASVLLACENEEKIKEMYALAKQIKKDFSAIELQAQQVPLYIPHT